MAQDGRYVFNNCVPSGDIDIANVSPGELLNRAWSFRVNSDDIPQQQLDNGSFDPRAIAHGSDGQLLDGDGNLLAEVNTWQARVAANTVDFQPGGSKVVWAIPMSFTVTLTFTETLVRDALLLARLLASVKAGSPDAVFNFQGVIRARTYA